MTGRDAGEVIAAVLAEHAGRPGAYGSVQCKSEECGYFSSWQEHFTHVAANLVAEGIGVLAEAWDEGYARGVRDEAGDIERADNPYRTEATS
jgi:hypothetical protein